MRQPDHEYEERSFGDIQRAIDFENSMNGRNTFSPSTWPTTAKVARTLCR